MNNATIFKIRTTRYVKTQNAIIEEIKSKFDPSFIYVDKEYETRSGITRASVYRIVVGFNKDIFSEGRLREISTFIRKNYWREETLSGYCDTPLNTYGSYQNPYYLPEADQNKHKSSPDKLYAFHFPCGQFPEQKYIEVMRNFKDEYNPALIFKEETSSKIVAMFKKEDLTKEMIEKFNKLSEVNLTSSYTVTLANDVAIFYGKK